MTPRMVTPDSTSARKEGVARLVNLLANGVNTLGALAPLPRARATEPLAALTREVIGRLAAVRREAFRKAAQMASRSQILKISV